MLQWGSVPIAAIGPLAIPQDFVGLKLFLPKNMETSFRFIFKEGSEDSPIVFAERSETGACCSVSSAPYEPAENLQAALSWRLRWAQAPVRALIGRCVLGVPVGAASPLRDPQHKVNPGWQ